MPENQELKPRIFEQVVPVGRSQAAITQRYLVAESSHINRLANRPYGSIVKTLPATLSEPWSKGQVPSTQAPGTWTMSRGSWTLLRGDWSWLLYFKRFRELHANQSRWPQHTAR